VIAALIVGALAGITVYAVVDVVMRRRRRSGWPPSTAAQLRDERKRRRLDLDHTNTNRWSSHR
jgi:hypothetical protein